MNESMNELERFKAFNRSILGLNHTVQTENIHRTFTNPPTSFPSFKPAHCSIHGLLASPSHSSPSFIPRKLDSSIASSIASRNSRE